MSAALVKLATNIIENLVEMVPKERQQAAQALQGLFLNSVENPNERRNAVKVSILVGPYGYIIANGYDEAAKLIGVKSTTLQSRLSSGHGQFTFSRQDPASGAQMDVVVSRGICGTHNPTVVEILVEAGGPWKRRSTKAKAPEPARNELGVVTTNRLARRNPVENT